jgi:8-oxo-dGTP diphosphatase
MEQPRVGVGVGVMIIRDGKLLLGKRHDDPEKAKSALKGAGTWTMPGGKLRFSETFEQVAARELLEETGMTLTSATVVCVNNDIVEGAHFITIGLKAEGVLGEAQVREPEQITEWRWFAMDDLPSPLFFASEKILTCYREKRFYKSA